MAFVTGLTGTGVTTANDAALWAWDPLEGLFPVVREGDLVTLSPGDVRTVSTFSLATAHQLVNMDNAFWPIGTGGVASGLNDAGQLTFGLRFTDGTSAVVVTTVPAPGTLVGLVGAWALGANRRRRRA